MSVARIGGVDSILLLSATAGGTPASITADRSAITINQTVEITGSPSALVITAAAHTTLANANAVDIDLDLSNTLQLTGGGAAIAEMTSIRVQPRTYAAVAAQTITKTVSLQVGSPVVGANVTLTNTFAIESAGNFLLGLSNDLVFDDDYDTLFRCTVDDQLLLRAGNAQVASWTSALFTSFRDVSVAQNIRGSGTPTAFLITAAAHTSLTNADNPDVLIDASNTLQFDGGGAAITMVNTVEILHRTYAAQVAQTITDASSLYVDAPPTAGANMTITNPWALWVDAGNVRLDAQLRVDSRLSVGTGALAAGAVVDVKQPSGTGAIYCTQLEQTDVDVAFTHFHGTAALGDISRNLVDYGDEGGSTQEAWIKIAITDDGGQITSYASYFLLAYKLS